MPAVAGGGVPLFCEPQRLRGSWLLLLLLLRRRRLMGGKRLELLHQGLLTPLRRGQLCLARRKLLLQLVCGGHRRLCGRQVGLPAGKLLLQLLHSRVARRLGICQARLEVTQLLCRKPPGVVRGSKLSMQTFDVSSEL